MHDTVNRASSTLLRTFEKHSLVVFAGFSLSFAIFALHNLSGDGDSEAGNQRSQRRVALGMPVSTGGVQLASVQSSSLPAMTYYLVGSERQRRFAMDIAEEMTESISQPHRSWTFNILLARTPDEETAAFEVIGDASRRWQEAGATGLEVVDLRVMPDSDLVSAISSAANQASRSGQRSVTAVPVIRTLAIYLVASDAERWSLMRDLDEGDAAESQPWLVLVAGTPSEDLAAAAKIHETSAFWRAQGNRVHVFDMRPPSED